MTSREELVLRLPCYEPAGHLLPLTLDELTQHVLLLDSTGSGKTSVLNEMLWQLLHHRAADPARKPGLLILDGKADDTVAKVRAWAAAAGRTAVVQVLDGDGLARFPLFAPLSRLEAVETVLRRVLAGAAPMSRENQFWEEARAAALRAALTLMTVDAGDKPYPERVGDLSAWLLNGDPPPQLERLCARCAAPAFPPLPGFARLALCRAPASRLCPPSRSRLTGRTCRSSRPLRARAARMTAARSSCPTRVRPRESRQENYGRREEKCVACLGSSRNG